MENQLSSKNPHQYHGLKKCEVLVLSTIVLGITSGGARFVILFESIEQLFLGYGETAKMPAPIAIMPLVRLLSVVIGGMIAAVIWCGFYGQNNANH